MSAYEHDNTAQPNRQHKNQSTSDHRYNVRVQVNTQYMEAHSKPEGNHYVFAYHIRITNLGSQSAQLLTRHWLITNSEGETQEVRGDGVIGEQPIIAPGQTHQYSSGTWLTTNLGFMQGHFGMQSTDGHQFKAAIDAFTLAVPGALH